MSTSEARKKEKQQREFEAAYNASLTSNVESMLGNLMRPGLHGDIAGISSAGRQYESELKVEKENGMDKSSLGLPIPIFVLGFDMSGNKPGVEIVSAIINDRQALSKTQQVYYPVMGVHDGLGSASPSSRLPYVMAISSGLSDASLRMICSGLIEEGKSLRALGISSPEQALDLAMQKRMVVVMATDDKKRQAKLLPAMQAAGKMGCFGVILTKGGGLNATDLKKIRSAFEDEGLEGRLLELDYLSGGQVLSQTANWYQERPELKEHVKGKAEAEIKMSRPRGKEETSNDKSGGDLQAAAEFTASAVAAAIADPRGTVRKAKAGDHIALNSISNILGHAVGQPGGLAVARPFLQEGLVDVCFEALKKGKGECASSPHYGLWQVALACLGNLSFFTETAEGRLMAKDICEARGYVSEVVQSRASQDATLKGSATLLQGRLKNLGLHRQVCAGCGKRESEERDRDFQVCSKCKCVCFCCSECLVADWAKEDGHKKMCKIMKRR